MPHDFPISLLRSFQQRFGRRACVASRAPGRINLIGEHVDYTGGYVLPCAIEKAFYVAGAPRDDGRVAFYSVEMDRDATADLDDLAPLAAPGWVNYGLGAIDQLRKAGVDLPGFDAAVTSTVPIGAGLSSSAAFEVATARFALTLAGAEMDPMELARLCRRAENEFVGVPCGLMDQFVSVFGRAEHAALLNCRTLEHRQVPLYLGGCVLLLCDTGVRHELGDTEYAKRQEECARALDAVRREIGPHILDLGMLGVEDYRKAAPAMDDVAARRARHAVTENARVLRSVDALERSDLVDLGAQLSASHASLRDDYEVSCPELDLVAEAAVEQAGVLGARMVGGGFGGCVLALAERERVDEIEKALQARYAKTGKALTFYVMRPGEGSGGWKVESGA